MISGQEDHSAMDERGSSCPREGETCFDDGVGVAVLDRERADEIAITNNFLVRTQLYYAGEVFDMDLLTSLTFPKGSGIARGDYLLASGYFFNIKANTTEFRNLALLLHNSTWIGVSESHGILNGVVFTVEEVEGDLVIGGFFNYTTEEGQYIINLARLSDYKTSLLTNEFEPIASMTTCQGSDKSLVFPTNSAIKALYYENSTKYLFIGGEFEIKMKEDELSNTTLTIQNFLIWDIANCKLVNYPGNSFPRGDVPRIPSTDGVTQFFPTIETFAVWKNELWIGGTFNTSVDGFYYASIARFDFIAMQWLPLGGLVRSQQASRALAGTVSAIHFNDTLSGPVNVGINNDTSPGVVVVYVGGVFVRPDGASNMFVPLYNTALACLLYNEEETGFMAGGILSPLNETSFTTTTDTPITCGGRNFGFYQPIGGVNGPVSAFVQMDMGDGEEQVLVVGGSFQSIESSSKTLSVNGCPIVKVKMK